MKLIHVFVLSVVFFCLPVQAQTESDAERVFAAVQAAEGSKVHEQMALTVRVQTTADALTQTFAALQQQVGEMKGHEPWEMAEGNGLKTFTCRVQFERADLQFNLLLDKACKIWGLTFTPAPPRKISSEKKEISSEKIEISSEIKSSPSVALPATLRMPDAAQRENESRNLRKCPCVVLVHGSGPSDRNETVGSNAFFSTLADTLVAAGIATLRYDKRSFVYGANTLAVSGGRMTFREECVEDAAAAVALAAQQEGIDAQQIFLLGHSLGGALLPLVAEASQVPVAGLIAVAAPARSLQEILPEQLEYIASVQHLSAEQQESFLQRTLAALPAEYLEMDAAYCAPQAYAARGERTIFLQGGHDYQVTDVDFQRFRAACPEAEAEWFPALDHLLRPLAKKAVPADYMRFIPVDSDALRRIVRFVRP